MLCLSFLCYLRLHPWRVLHAGCGIAFIVQMSILASSQIYPSETVSHVEERTLDGIEFPVLFKICIKPAFDIKELDKAGYSSIWHYFIGQSKYNASIFGWAGHAQDGRTIGSVKGVDEVNIVKT